MRIELYDKEDRFRYSIDITEYDIKLIKKRVKSINKDNKRRKTRIKKAKIDNIIIII